MKLVIAVSHVDISAALRQMAWIGFLSSKNGNSMLGESVLLVVSRRAAQFPKFKQLCWLAARIFGEARCLVPDREHETGWPGAPNWMFRTALDHVEAHWREDLFFLEPDGVPLNPLWFDRIQEEWLVAQSAGKCFMGAFVKHCINHMTGIAVYGAEWRREAPMLASVPDGEAWDCYAAPEVLPKAHFTPLIQHVFRRQDVGWSVPGLGILDARAVLFHQDKKGKLVSMLDQAYHGNECRRHPLFGYADISDDEKVMRKFYYTANATRAVKANGRKFVFEALGCHGGAMIGAYTTEFESEQVALSHLTSDPTSGITEISKEEWENLTKKKSPEVPNTNTSKPSNGILPQAALLPTPSNSPAVLVAEPGSAATKEGTAGGPIKDISDVIKIDSVQPAQIVSIGAKLPRPENRARFNLARNQQEAQ